MNIGKDEVKEERVKTRWSRAGKPKGHHTVRRFPTIPEMKALAKLWKKQPKEMSPHLVSLMYRLVEGYQGSKKEIDEVKALLPPLPEGVEWKVSDKNKTLADPQHMVGVEFSTEKTMDGFFVYLSKQEDPQCLTKFLMYAEAYKAEQKAMVATATPTKKAPPKAAKQVTPEVASLGTESDPLAIDDSDDEDTQFVKFMSDAFEARKNLKRKYKTDKSEE